MAGNPFDRAFVKGENGVFLTENKQEVEIPISAEEYPKEWKGLPDAPPILYARGDICLLQERKLTVVGSRRTPTAALKLGTQIAKDLSGTMVIVTGAADGGDSAAIEGALQGGGKIICVLAGGFSSLPQGNISLLQEVEKRGLLLSPYPYETAVRAFSYEYRNKLLATLGKGVLVLGAAEKSGALITAKYAQKEGKPIFALPYFPGSSAGAGCNLLLKSGGVLTENAADVAAVLGISLTEKKRELVLTEEERRMRQALTDMSEGHVSELASKSGIPAFKARSVLSALEVKGLAVSLGGNRYAPL